MMEFMPENFFLDLNSQSCCIFSSLCRFCKNSRAKCYVQERLFIEWCNFYLRLVNCEINSLADLWDWTIFLALLDGLGRERQLMASSLKESKEINENWDIVQDYLIKENIIKPIISKGKSPIVRRTFTHWLSEILWSLIFRHYFDLRSFKMSRGTAIDYHKASQSLIKWMKFKIQNCFVGNLTTDLQNGNLICQLIDAIVPKSIDSSVYAETTHPEDRVSYAIKVAKNTLGIPSLISASDIANCKADEVSLLTYIALFRSADRMLAKGIRPVSPRSNVLGSAREAFEINRTKQSNMAYGFGIRYGEVGKPTEFIVHVDEKEKSDVHISITCTPEIEDVAKIKAEPKLKPIGDCGYIISYTPVIAGYYEISVLCGMKHIKNSPYKIRVQEPEIDSNHYTEPGEILSIEAAKQRPTNDYLLFSDDPPYHTQITELDNLSNNIPCRHESLNTIDSGIDGVVYNDNVNCDYLSTTENSDRGSYVPSSPNCFSKGGSESSAFSDFDFFEARGSGLDSGEVGVMSHFEVRTPNGNNGPLSVLVTCPAVSIPTPYVNTRTDGDQLIHDVMFLPTEPGSYEIELKWGKKLVTGSPFTFLVTEAACGGVTETNTKELDNFLNEAIKHDFTAVMYYSATSGDVRHTRRCDYLASILRNEIANLNLKRIAIDLEIPSDERRHLMSKIKGNITLPFVYLNRKFLGTFEVLVGQYRKGLLRSHIEHEFDYLNTVEEVSNHLDFKTLNKIKHTLFELQTPMST